ncbi:MAG: SDR family oxidoreductase [Deltaproteobacteria bacterium]|nr:SDR family oxidoreductase [Candidatus Zymogenaceae bacterium]
MRIFITGGTGLLGRNLITYLEEKHTLFCSHFPAVPVDRDHIPHYLLDITERERVFDILGEVKPDVIVHTASCGNVDWVEKNREQGRKVNVEGTKNIVDAARKIDARVIFTSTNAVFDGENAPYREEDPTHPINMYGKTKVEGERIVSQAGTNHTIVRPILMYGWNHPQERQNPVTWLLVQLREGIQIKLVDDIYANPLLVDDCSMAIKKIIEEEKSGLYHIAGGERLNRYEMGVMTAEVFDLDVDLLSPVKNSFFQAIAPRPVDTSYDVSKMISDLGVRPRGMREGLVFMRESDHG